MIQSLSHTSIYVLDQEPLVKFYRDKLGFEVRDDVTMDNGFRWVTVGPKNAAQLAVSIDESRGRPDVRRGDCGDADEARQTGNIRHRRIRDGRLQSDVQRTRCQRRGVHGPPEEKFYGIKAIGKDSSGNWFSMDSTRQA